MTTYTLELKLNTKKYSDQRYLENYFREVAKISNTVRRFAIRQITMLKRDKTYVDLLKQYVALEKGPEKEALSKQLSVIVKSYGLTQYDLQKSATKLRNHLKYVHSAVYQKISDSVWKGVEKVLYSTGKQIHYKKWDEFLSFEGKKNTTGIIYKDGKVYINASPKRQNRGLILDVILPGNQNTDHWYYETSALNDRTKYCRIVRKKFSTGWRYYVQLVQEGIPPLRHAVGTGRIGIDIGTSTVAVVSGTKCHLTELGEGIEVQDKKIRKMQRKLERSRRTSNPDNYNADGTIKKGRKTWNYSRRYKKIRNELSAMQRKRSDTLRQWQEAYADLLLEEGNEVYVEDMNFKGLQKRSKKTEKNKKGKYKRKKRFGKSIGTRAPSQFLTILKRKLGYTGGTYHEVNTRTFKASQYDHTSDTYRKKKLSRRHNTINGEWIQRDLYSAFLLMNSDDTLEHTDRNKCLQNYPQFKNMHNQCITEILRFGKHIPSSFGLKRAA